MNDRQHAIPDARPLIVVLGATATGKTHAGIALASALGGEIVSADSRQVYRGMAIGTAQPTPAELALVPHHLVGCIAPDEPFGLATYLDMANNAISAIRARGNIPIVVGGTGQYIRALIEGWTVPRIAPDPGLRSELERFASEFGAGALHTRLRGVDAPAAAAIHPHNVRRIIRALEVYGHTGEPISSQQRRLPHEVPAIVIGLCLERQALYRRIDRRVESMYAAGLLDEVRTLAAQGFHRSLPGMASIGYPEAWAVLAGELTVDEAIQRTQLATHRLARQQSTWFRAADPRVQWIDAASSSFVERVAEVVSSSLR